MTRPAVFVFGGPRLCALATIHAERAGWWCAGMYADLDVALRAARGHETLTLVLDAGCMLDALYGSPAALAGFCADDAIAVEAARATGERFTERPAAFIARAGTALVEPPRVKSAVPTIGTWCAGITPRAMPELSPAAPRLTGWLPILGTSGYAVAARNLALGMRGADVDVVVPYHWNDEPAAELFAADSDVIDAMERPANTRDPALIYRPVTGLFGGPYFDNYRALTQAPLIACTMFETDELPARWPGALARCDAVWVPSEAGREIFVRSGVSEVGLSVVPIGLDVARFFPDGPRLELADSRTNVFLSVFEWGNRKGTDVLLAAWARAFGPDDDVVLYLRTGSRRVDGTVAVAQLLEYLRIDRAACAPIVVLPDAIPDHAWASLYRRADAFVLPSRGEGFCIPYLEAMAAGVPVIGTAYPSLGAGANDLLSAATGTVISARLDSTDEELAANIPLYAKLRWLEPDVEATAAAMHAVVRDPAGAAQRAATAFARAHRVFDRDVVGALAARTFAEVRRRAPLDLPAAFTLVGPATALDADGEATRSLMRVADAAGIGVAMAAHPEPFTPQLDAYDADRIANARDRERVSAIVRVGTAPDADATIRYLHTPPASEAEMRAIARTPAIWVTDDATARSLRKAGISANRIAVIPLAIDVARFGPDARTTLADLTRTFVIVPLDFRDPRTKTAATAILPLLLGDPHIAVSLMLVESESEDRNQRVRELLERTAAGSPVRALIGAITMPPVTADGLRYLCAHQVIVNMPGLPASFAALSASAALALVEPAPEHLRRILADRRTIVRDGRARRHGAKHRVSGATFAADFRDALDEHIVIGEATGVPRIDDVLIVVTGDDAEAAARTAQIAATNAAAPVRVVCAPRVDETLIASAGERYVAQIPGGAWVGSAWDTRLISVLRRSVDVDAVAAISSDHPLFADDIRSGLAEPSERQRTAYFTLLMAPPQEHRIVLDTLPETVPLLARRDRWGAIRRVEVDPRTVYVNDTRMPSLTSTSFPAAPLGEAPIITPPEHAPPARADCVRVLWRGDFLPNHSMARVNRMLASAMVAYAEIDIVPQGEPTANVETLLGLPARRIEACPPVATAIALKHQWPPLYRAPHDGLSIHIQPYEYGALPVMWQQRSLARVDDVWCYTKYVQQQYIAAGMPPERTCVIPLGFDPAVYHPDVAPADVGSPDTFVFLFVGGTIWRKGIDVLLDAYLSAFTPSDDVALIVKAFGNTTFYATQHSSDRVLELTTRSDVPRVRYGDGDLSDAAMAGLYRRANVLLQPYRGEGFGLPVLEAMACGTPPIVTLGGATDDFVTDTIGYRIPAKRIDLGVNFAQDMHAASCWALEPEVSALARYMRYAFENRDEVRARGVRAAAYVRDRFTWAHAARHALDRIAEIASRTPLAREGENESLQDFEQHVNAASGEDGIVIELFSRLRVRDPLLVEFAPGGGIDSSGATLALRGGWNAVMIEPDAARFAAHREAYKNHPLVRSVHGADDAAVVATLLHENGVPPEFDFLSITAAHVNDGLFGAVAAWKPRVVVVRRESTSDEREAARIVATASALGYAWLGHTRSETRLIFVIRPLLAATGFPEAPSP